MNFQESDKKVVDSVMDTESQIELDYSNQGCSRTYGLKCDLINKCMQEEYDDLHPHQPTLVSHVLSCHCAELDSEGISGSSSSWQGSDGWQTGVAVVLGQVQQELHPSRVEFATLAIYAGLITGSTVWGVMADLIGRKLSFNITLFLAGVFGIAAGGAPNFVAFACLEACLGFGIGGNVPVDGALYLEHIPQTSQWTLTLLGAWWAFGQFVASLIAWGFIGHYSCEPTATLCLKADNMGWRYSYYTFGCMTLLMFLIRFVVFDVQESPKYLVAKGRDQEALADPLRKVLEHIAKRNNKSISLTLEQFAAIDGGAQSARKPLLEVVKDAFSTFSLSHVRPLFTGRRLAINTTLIILCWGAIHYALSADTLIHRIGLIGLAYPLFNAFLPLYLKQRVVSSPDSGSIDTTYRNYVIISIVGALGSILASLIIDWTRGLNSRWFLGGRKLIMSMYSVLYQYTPEVFPAPHRGTGDAIASSFNRIMGIFSPVIKIATTAPDGTALPGYSPNSPVFVSATLFVVTGVLMAFLPIETAGRAAM
ncbi:hypothetical protein C0995_005452 [Termitomyces sp. Mi166|nr:hypothetical protein C0995_005452 [Termitomyces sp. Mi166\